MSASVASGRRGQRQVLAHRADEHVVLLGDQGDVSAQVVERQLGQSDAADGDRSGAGRVDAGEQPAEGRLARPRRPHHREPFADLEGQVDAVEDVASLDVREAHVLGLDPLALRLAAGGDPVVGHVRDPQEPGERRRPDLELVEDPHDAVDGVDEHLDIERRRGDVAQRHLAADVEPAAEEQRRHARQEVRRHLDAGEEPRAEVERVALRGVGPGAVVVDRRDPLLLRGRAPRWCGRPRRSR